MKTWIMSDLHNDRGIEDIGVNPPDFDVFVCAGDVLTGDIAGSIAMVAAIARGKPAVFVAGNHEWMSAGFFRPYAETYEIGLEAARRHGVHFLELDAAEIGGVRFAGATLWTPFDVRHSASVRFLKTANADVIVTHFEPGPEVLPALTYRIWIYGHHHGFADVTTSDGRRLVRNAIGYPLTALPADEMPRQDSVVEVAR